MTAFLKIFAKLNMPQALVLVAAITGFVLVLLFAPPEVLAKIPWPALVGGGAVSTAAVVSAFLGHVVKRNPDRRERSSDPTDIT